MYVLGPNVSHNVTGTSSTVYEVGILLVPGGPLNRVFVAWQRRARNSNATTGAPVFPAQNDPIRQEAANLRIVSMTSDLDGTQFRYFTSAMATGQPTDFTSGWTTTLIGRMC